MNIGQTLYRFYEPGIKTGRLFTKCILQAILFSSFDILTILVFRWMAIFAEQRNIYYLEIIAR
ncbi:hypothetical protein KA037_00350 [Patescibacteria group bacterium]|nr:hypothetical protein [Patescibacteria group bacterium]MBP7841119.1 hypothetical protein [Patescibacteria group bacterium]